MSASRPPLSSRPAFLPDEIARREFATTFRGYDPAEVRTFLNQLSEQSAELADRIAELQLSLADTQARVNNPELDEETVTKLLGEQTAQILRSAREAANEMRINAEAEVSRSLREAHEVTNRMRSEAETVLRDRTTEAEMKANELREESTNAANTLLEEARRDSETLREEAEKEAKRIRDEVAEEAQRMRDELRVELERREADHEARTAQELEAARQRGRDLVDTARAEAQLLVDRTAAEQAEKLETLVRKRKIALAQVEELRAGRQRLLKAYKMVRGTLDEITSELTRVEDEARQAAGIAGVTAAQSSGIAQEELDTVVELEKYSLNDDVPKSVIDLIEGREVSTEQNAAQGADSSDDNEDDQGDQTVQNEPRSTSQGGGANFFDGELAYEEEVELRPADQRTQSGDNLPGTRNSGNYDAVDLRSNAADQESESFSEGPRGNSQTSHGAGGPIAMLSREDQIVDAEVIEDSEAQMGEQQVLLGDDTEDEKVQARVASSFIIGESFATGNAQLDRNVSLRRDAVVTKNRPQAVRRLKRTLQDEQDALTAQLRNGKVSSAAELLGSLDDQATTYQRAIVKLFREVVRAGASSVEGSTGVEPGTVDHSGTNAARALALELVEDLRSQLEPVLDEIISAEEMADNNTLQSMVAAPYRVVKGDYLEHLVDDRIGGAFDQGVTLAR